VQAGGVFKHILVPSDGSGLSARAVEAAVDFARQIGARVTGFTAVPEYCAPGEPELMSRRMVSLEQHEANSRRLAEATLGEIARRARDAGVEYDAEYVQSDHPWEAIVAAAERRGCDLIIMGTHARRGFSAMVHGSETREVLAHSRIPTLVIR
jgi:nucleotide-binding universal stress UspA family protein